MSYCNNHIFCFNKILFFYIRCLTTNQCSSFIREIFFYFYKFFFNFLNKEFFFL